MKGNVRVRKLKIIFTILIIMSRECVFCNILKTDRYHQIIDQNKHVTAIKKSRERFRVDFLIIPNYHVVNMKDLNTSTNTLNEIVKMANKLSKQTKTGCGDYSVHFNNGPNANQSVFHMHAHIKSPDTDWGNLKPDDK